MNTTLPTMSLGLLGGMFAEATPAGASASDGAAPTDFDDALESVLAEAKDATDANDPKDAKDDPPGTSAMNVAPPAHVLAAFVQMPPTMSAPSTTAMSATTASTESSVPDPSARGVSIPTGPAAAGPAAASPAPLRAFGIAKNAGDPGDLALGVAGRSGGAPGEGPSRAADVDEVAGAAMDPIDVPATNVIEAGSSRDGVTATTPSARAIGTMSEAAMGPVARVKEAMPSPASTAQSVTTHTVMPDGATKAPARSEITGRSVVAADAADADGAAGPNANRASENTAPPTDASSARRPSAASSDPAAAIADPPASPAIASAAPAPPSAAASGIPVPTPAAGNATLSSAAKRAPASVPDAPGNAKLQSDFKSPAHHENRKLAWNGAVIGSEHRLAPTDTPTVSSTALANALGDGSFGTHIIESTESEPLADPLAEPSPAPAPESPALAPAPILHAPLPLNPHDPVKTMTATNPTPTPTLSAEQAQEAVRVAESLGHKRVLTSGEARGHIVIPELGRIEVRAHTHAIPGVSAAVQVNVQVDDAQARAVVQQHASELRAHVHAEVPNAHVHLDQRGNSGQFTRDSSGQPGHSGQRDARQGADDSAQDDHETAVQRQIPQRLGAARYVL